MDFHKYFVCACDLLDFDLSDIHHTIAFALEKTPDASFFVAHPYGFLFSGYQELLQGKILPAEFLALGDITSTRPLSPFSCPVDPVIWFDALVQRINHSPESFRGAIIVVQGSVEYPQFFSEFGILVFSA